jgi:TrmH family RNA methyltransferase
MSDHPPALISSRANPAIKQIRALATRKERERSGLFFVEGIRLVLEAVQVGAEVVQGVVAPDLLKGPAGREAVGLLRAREVPCLQVTAEVFAGLSAKEGPQGLGAVVRQRWEPLAAAGPGTGPGWVALDAVQDPGNLGTILRTGDAVGAAGVILVGPTTDPYDPAAVRASMGAIFTQRLVRATWAEFAAWKQEVDITLIGSSDKAAADYQAVAYCPPLVLFMGSERQGLSAEQQALCDLMVRIPMVGRSDSLNLAVATGVILYEIFNQQRAASNARPGASGDEAQGRG